jgi:hypothetical protein
MFKALPSANDAAAKVLQGQYEKAEVQSAKVESAILRAIQSGQRSVSLGESLEQAVSNKLKNMGYETKYHSDQRDGSFTTITW